MEFLILASAHFLALLSPGPDFFLIIQTSLRLPLRYAFALCAGIAVANGVYLVFAVLGLEIIKELAWLVVVLKYVGAAYLIYIGYLLLMAPRRPLGSDAVTVLHVKSLKRQFVLGFMSGFLNPKNAIFYLSLFTVMVSPQTSLGVRSVYALWMTSLVLFWDMGVACLLGSSLMKQKLERYIFGIEKFAGGMLTFLGVFLIID